mgnify:CR=1 FL=1
MQFYPFSAMLARMKYISRWGLMRSSRTESLCEHTADTALLAHTLALLCFHLRHSGALRDRVRGGAVP